MINNISENPINDDFPSDYCDDFEDYESDFEDDEEIDESDQNDDRMYDMKDEIIPSEQSYATNGYYRSETPVKSAHDDNRLEMSKTVLEKNETKAENKYKPITASMRSAKMKSDLVVQRSASNKRSKELLEIIKLNEISFVDFDWPPINYDIFIKTFGRKDAKQVSCQTSECEDKEIQTNSVFSSDKWTQNPSFTRIVSGNEEQLNENDLNEEVVVPKVDSFELLRFLTKAEVLMSAIIDIEVENNFKSNKRNLPKGKIILMKIFGNEIYKKKLARLHFKI